MKTLRAGPPIVVDDLQLIPVESTRLYVGAPSGRLVAMAAKEPVAIVVRSANRIWAVDLDGRETAVETLLHSVDGLQDITTDVG